VDTITDINSAITSVVIEGDYNITGNFAFEIPPAIRGDVNGDNKLNALDITKVERLVAGID